MCDRNSDPTTYDRPEPMTVVVVDGRVVFRGSRREADAVAEIQMRTTRAHRIVVKDIVR